MIDAPKLKACLITSKELSGMLKALRLTKAFKVERDSDTAKVTHLESGYIVLSALAKSSKGPWIARIAQNLFAQ